MNVETAPICPFCMKAVRKSPQKCPQCRLSYHPNCWRQVRYCMTCGLENEGCAAAADKGKKPGKKRLVRAGEAVSIRYDQFFRRMEPYFVIPGGTLPLLGVFLFLFKSDNPWYIYMAMLGLAFAALGKLVSATGSCYHIVSPSSRSIQRHIGLFGLHGKHRLLSFKDVQAVRIEGERRFKGSQKGVPSYYYNAFFIVAVSKDGRHVRLSDEVRTDQDPDFMIGDEYEFGGLLPLARKAGAAVGVDVYVAPNISPYRWWPTLVRSILLFLAATALLLFF